MVCAGILFQAKLIFILNMFWCKILSLTEEFSIFGVFTGFFFLNHPSPPLMKSGLLKLSCYLRIS